MEALKGKVRQFPLERHGQISRKSSRLNVVVRDRWVWGLPPGAIGGYEGNISGSSPRLKVGGVPSSLIRIPIPVVHFYWALSVRGSFACSRCQLRPMGSEKAWQPISSNLPKKKIKKIIAAGIPSAPLVGTISTSCIFEGFFFLAGCTIDLFTHFAVSKHLVSFPYTKINPASQEGLKYS